MSHRSRLLKLEHTHKFYTAMVNDAVKRGYAYGVMHNSHLKRILQLDNLIALEIKAYSK